MARRSDCLVLFSLIRFLIGGGESTSIVLKGRDSSAKTHEIACQEPFNVVRVVLQQQQVSNHNTHSERKLESTSSSQR